MIIKMVMAALMRAGKICWCSFDESKECQQNNFAAVGNAWKRLILAMQ